VPKALHANMFLVRRAGEAMERDVAILSAEADFASFLRQHGGAGGFKHVVVKRDNHVVGVVRVNTGLRHGLEDAYTGVHLGDVAQRNFTIARESDIMFDVVHRMARHNASMTAVVKDGGRGRPSEILGVISKEHIADSVADSVKTFGK
jgi:chloride channel protein, CIC family